MITDDDLARLESRTLDARTIHVLNNHLGVILGFVDLALEETPESDPRRRDLVEIKQAAVAAVALLAPAQPILPASQRNTEGE